MTATSQSLVANGLQKTYGARPFGFSGVTAFSPPETVKVSKALS